MNTIANGTQVPKETKETKVLFSVNALPGETSTKFNARIKREKRKATNEAGKKCESRHG